MFRFKAFILSVILIITLLLAGPSLNAFARSPKATSPTLGAAASYSVLGGQTVINGGGSTMPGDLGVSPGTAVVGFPPGQVGPPGTIHAGDSSAADAQIANSAAFDFLDQGCTTSYPGTQDLVGMNLVPGVYCADAFALSGTLTLSGSGVWIFKSAADLITSGGANVSGGDPCTVWWRLVSSGTLGTNTSLIGNILASTSITLQSGASLNGRAFAQTGQVSLANNSITDTGGCLAAPAATATATATATSTATTTTTPTVTPTLGPGTPSPTATATATITATPTVTPTLGPGTPSSTPVPATSVPGSKKTPVGGLPNTGGAPIRSQDSIWGLVFVTVMCMAAVIMGVRSARRNHNPKQ